MRNSDTPPPTGRAFPGLPSDSRLIRILIWARARLSLSRPNQRAYTSVWRTSSTSHQCISSDTTQSARPETAPIRTAGDRQEPVDDPFDGRSLPVGGGLPNRGGAQAPGLVTSITITLIAYRTHGRQGNRTVPLGLARPVPPLCLAEPAARLVLSCLVRRPTNGVVEAPRADVGWARGDQGRASDIRGNDAADPSSH